MEQKEIKKIRNCIVLIAIMFTLMISMMTTKVEASTKKGCSLYNPVFATTIDEAVKYLKSQYLNTDYANQIESVYMVTKDSASYIETELYNELLNFEKNPSEAQRLNAYGQFYQCIASQVTDSSDIKTLEKSLKRNLSSGEKFINVDVWLIYHSSESNFKRVDKRAKEIAKSLNLNGLSTAQKVRKVSDWFINNVEYDYSFSGNGEADNPLLYGKGVCGEIANAVAMVLSNAGVHVRAVESYLQDGVRHAWNIVYDNGYWKSLDICWNINLGYNAYTLVSRYSFDEMHSIHSDYTNRTFLQYHPLYGDSLEGWVKSSGKWYYRNDSGNYVKGWKKIKNKWYYFDSYGVMKTGWLKSSGEWYYLGGDGAMLTGWQVLKDSHGKFWFYLGSDGACRYGWHKISGKWYYFDSNGHMLTGFKNIKYNGKMETFYMDSSGAMKIGWQYINKKWYYFNKTTGVMLKNWQKLEDSKGKFWFYFNSNGVMLTGWQTIKYNGKDHKFYFDGSGHMLTGRQKIDGKWYTFNSDGTLK